MAKITCEGCQEEINTDQISALFKEDGKILVWCNTCYKKGLHLERKEKIRLINEEREKAKKN